MFLAFWPKGGPPWSVRACCGGLGSSQGSPLRAKVVGAKWGLVLGPSGAMIGGMVGGIAGSKSAKLHSCVSDRMCSLLMEGRLTLAGYCRRPEWSWWVTSSYEFRD